VLHQSVPPHSPHPTLRAALALLICVGCLAFTPALAAATTSLTWSGPTEVDAGHKLTAIACPAATLCVAVDDAGRAVVGTRSASAAAWSWSTFAIDGGRTLSSISCPSTALCVAVDGEGRAIIGRNPSVGPGSWSAVTIDGTTPLTSVSCASNAFCVAVDSAGRALFTPNPTLAAASAWLAPVTIDSTTPLTSVSCTPNAVCVAVDGEGHAVLSTEPTGGAAAWHVRLIDPALGLEVVSCFASDSCVAVDRSGNVFASADAAAAIGSGSSGSGATWSSTALNTLTGPSAVSCAQIGLCATVYSTGEVFASDNPTTAPPAWVGGNIDPTSALTAVSCTTEGLCAAADASGRVFTAEAPAPLASTAPASEVAHTSALLIGTVDPNDAALSSCRFEYGTSTIYEASAPCASSPNGSAAAPVSAIVASLVANTTYHYRLVASTAIGTSIGADQTFKTLAPNVVEPHPSISGTPAPGQRLTCKSGVTTTTGVTLAYAWLRDTKTISGASATTYLVSSADVSHHLQCRVSATTTEGTRSATSAFVTVPAGGLGTISETTVGAPRAGRNSVSVPLKCSAQAAGSCKLKLRLTVLETLHGTRVVAVAAQTRRTTVTVGSRTARLKPGQQATVAVTLNATGKQLLARMRRLPVKLSVSGTVVGAISASLKSTTVTLAAAGRASSHKASHGRSAARGKRATRGKR
jgi:hypothetical protein